jgi:hypothetical protein
MGKRTVKPPKLPPKRKGRPSNYSQAIAQKILELYVAGSTLTAICAIPGMPKASTLYRWLAETPDFKDAYLRARETKADLFVDELVSLSDEAQGMGVEGVAAMRLRIETRKWVASKFFPRTYADRLEHQVGGTGPLTGLAIIVPLKELPGAGVQQPALASPPNPLIIEAERVD